MLDVVVVGGGPAGTSAALVLGRCRRRVALVDSGHPRNHAAQHIHGFLTRDGARPGELRALALEQLRPYGVRIVHDEAVSARRRLAGGFEVELAGGPRLTARRLLLATGIRDRLPTVEGFSALYGVSAHHCPFCDGWEARDQPLLAYGQGPEAVELAVLLSSWSRDVLLCTDGAALQPSLRARLSRARIAWRVDRIARLEGRRGQLERVVFADGDAVPRRRLFFHLGEEPGPKIAERLGCAASVERGVHAGELGETTQRGVWVAGDASKDVLLAIVAAAEGAKAAVDIHASLLEEDLAYDAS